MAVSVTCDACGVHVRNDTRRGKGVPRMFGRPANTIVGFNVTDLCKQCLDDVAATIVAWFDSEPRATERNDPRPICPTLATVKS